MADDGIIFQMYHFTASIAKKLKKMEKTKQNTNIGALIGCE